MRMRHIKELLAALSINKSQLAQILRVTRPTIYDWFQGKEPNDVNAEKLCALVTLLKKAYVSSVKPLNACMVRRSLKVGDPSLIELLSAEELDEELIISVVGRIKQLEEKAAQKRAEKESFEFERLGLEKRKGLLAKNMALKEWPR